MVDELNGYFNSFEQEKNAQLIRWDLIEVADGWILFLEYNYKPIFMKEGGVRTKKLLGTTDPFSKNYIASASLNFKKGYLPC